MRTYSVQVFDDFVVTPGGPSSPYYSAAEHNALLGTADAIAVGAVLQYVSGPPITLEVDLEQSGDGKNWIGHPDGEVIDAAGVNGLTTGFVSHAYALLSSVRFKVVISASGQATCRIKLYATGRSVGRARSTGAGQRMISPR